MAQPSVESKKESLEKTTPQGEQSGKRQGAKLQLVDGPVPEDGRVGDRLRAARLQKSLEIEDAARKLKLRADYIEAMESMQAKLLPKGLVNFYVRDYARIVGLDPQKTVNDFVAQCSGLRNDGTHINASQKQITPAKDKAVLPILAVGTGVLVAGLIGAGVWMFSQSSGGPVEQPETTQIVLNGASEPQVRSAAPATAPVRSGLQLEILALKRAWIEIRGADGTVFISRTLAPGETYKPRVGAGWTVTTREGNAFVWQTEGEVIGSIGETNAAVYAVSVDAAARAIEDARLAETAEAAGVQPAVQ